MKKEETQIVETPISPENLRSMRISRFGHIFYNIAMASAALALIALSISIILPLISFIVMFVILGIVLALVVFTVGLIFLSANNPIPYLLSILGDFSNSSLIHDISAFCFNNIQWIALVGAIISAVALVFAAMSKETHKTVRIVTLSGLIVLLAFAFVFFLLTGGLK